MSTEESRESDAIQPDVPVSAATSADAAPADPPVDDSSVEVEAPSVAEDAGSSLSSDSPSSSSPSPPEVSDDAAAVDAEADDDDDDDDEFVGHAEPIEEAKDDDDSEDEEGVGKSQWYILKVQVNREESIRDALQRRVKIEGLDEHFTEIVVPTEDVAEFTKTGKRRVVKRKIFPGYIMVNMILNDDSWFLVRETPGIGDFTGSAGKPTPMDPREVDRILKTDEEDEDEGTQVKTAIPFKNGDRVRVKEGNFQNFEGDVDKIDEAHGFITVVIPIFGRPTPVEIPHWQLEKV